jgi:predicted Zn finger-like uncharacterized protein
MAKTKVICPQCEAVYYVEVASVGKKGRCSKCKALFALKPAASDEKPGPSHPPTPVGASPDAEAKPAQAPQAVPAEASFGRMSQNGGPGSVGDQSQAKQRFAELRARGLPLAGIALELGTDVVTVMRWLEEFPQDRSGRPERGEIALPRQAPPGERKGLPIHGVAGQIALGARGAVMATHQEVLAIQGPMALGCLVAATICLGLTILAVLASEVPSVLEAIDLAGYRIPVRIIPFTAVCCYLIWQLVAGRWPRLAALRHFESALKSRGVEESSLKSLREEAGCRVWDIKSIQRVSFDCRSMYEHGTLVVRMPGMTFRMEIAPSDGEAARDLVAFCKRVSGK